MRKIGFTLGLLAASMAAAVARAHPHVFIDMRSAVSFNAAGHVDAIGVSWTFDEFYSQFATDGIDANANGKFDTAELQQLADSIVKNLSQFRYFTFVELDGKLIDNPRPTNARAIMKDGQLTFVFRLPLAKPVNPATVKVNYTSFDPSYYIDIAPAGTSAVTFAGAPKGCTHAIRTVDTSKPGALPLARKIQMMVPSDGLLQAVTASIVDVTCPRNPAS